MNRRRFLIASGGALPWGWAARAEEAQRIVASQNEALEERLAAWIQIYDTQGNHRTGTEADLTAAQWLAAELHRVGLAPTLEPFEFSRVVPQSCYLRIGDRRVDGVPAFDAAFTDAGGIRGRIGPLGSDADIGLAETRPFALLEPRGEQRGAVAEARKSAHKAVVLLTRGSRPGLFLLNALSFANPAPIPILQVSSAEAEWLQQAAQARSEVTLVAHAVRTQARAHNVVASIAGSRPELAPLVVSTPFSGWWQCAGERGGGIACWLESASVLAESRPERPCVFVGLSGHELANLGLLDYVKRRPDAYRQAHRWIHYGANIGVPHQPNLVHVADDELERWAASTLKRQGLAMNAAPREDLPRGEGLLIHRGGARYVTLTCGTNLFHNAADRWPEEVDVRELARYALSFSNALRDAARLT